MERQELKTFEVTVNEKTYRLREYNIDNALCTAYRKYHLGMVNVYDHIFWHLGKTQEQVTWKEITL